MPTRQLAYPDQYSAEMVEGGDIKLRFNAPGSRFGDVVVILVADDAECLINDLDKAISASTAFLLAEAESNQERKP